VINSMAGLSWAHYGRGNHSRPSSISIPVTSRQLYIDEHNCLQKRFATTCRANWNQTMQIPYPAANRPLRFRKTSSTKGLIQKLLPNRTPVVMHPPAWFWTTTIRTQKTLHLKSRTRRHNGPARRETKPQHQVDQLNSAKNQLMNVTTETILSQTPTRL